MPDRAPDVSVVIPAYNAAATLGATLAALAAQRDAPPFEVLLVDDGSTDDTLAVARAAELPLRVVRGPGQGAGLARNAGVQAAAAPVIAFTDADCAPVPAWLATGLRALDGLDILQGAVLPKPGVPVGPWDRTLGVVSEYGLYETANLFVRAEWWKRVGGFAEPRGGRSSGRPFGEDTSFAWRAKRAGARSGFSSEALVHHEVFPGRWSDILRERARARYFPLLVARTPELRDAFLYRRWFLSARTAAFDAAALAVLAAAVRRSPLPLALAAPYARLVVRDSRRWRGADAVKSALVGAAGDAVGAAALVRGSAEQRTVVL